MPPLTALAPAKINLFLHVGPVDADGYHPSTLPELSVGRPVRLIIDSEDTYTCASSFVIPGLGIEKRLKPGENVIEFTPTSSGEIPFSCSIGMYRGAFEVR